MLANTPTAIGRSKDGPSFFVSAGARLMVIRFAGKANPEFFMAVRTLSFDSLTAEPGSPTISKHGKPFEMSTSTWTVYPSIPFTAPLNILDSIKDHSLSINVLL